MDKFPCSLALPNIKYNCAVSFWSQLHWLFIYVSKYIFPHKKNFLIDTHTKIGTEITDIIVFRKKLLKFLQGVIALQWKCENLLGEKQPKMHRNEHTLFCIFEGIEGKFLTHRKRLAPHLLRGWNYQPKNLMRVNFLPTILNIDSHTLYRHVRPSFHHRSIEYNRRRNIFPAGNSALCTCTHTLW